MRTKGGKPCKIFVTGQWAFIPTERAGLNGVVLYLKVPSCVVYVGCPNSSCGAKAGELCNGTCGPTTMVHCGRKSLARARLQQMPEYKIQNCGPLKIG